MYASCLYERAVIIAPDFTIQITHIDCTFMMVERMHAGQFKGLIIPLTDGKLRYQYYYTTRPKCIASVPGSKLRCIRNLIRDNAYWILLDFPKQRDVMNLLCEFMY